MSSMGPKSQVFSAPGFTSSLNSPAGIGLNRLRLLPGIENFEKFFYKHVEGKVIQCHLVANPKALFPPRYFALIAMTHPHGK